MTDDTFEHSMQLENEKYYYMRIDDESFILKKKLDKAVSNGSIDITGTRAILGTCSITNGRISFLSNTEAVTPSSDIFGLFIPPFSIYRTECDFEESVLSLLVSADSVIAEASSHPVVFPTTVRDFKGTDEQIHILLNEISGEGAASMTCCENPAALKAKKVIDEQFPDIHRLSTLAHLIGIQSWELSRLFKESYGMSPLKYLNNIRTIEAVYKLLSDSRKSKIIDVAFNVGFRDLSRFNKQFKKIVRFIPRNLFS